jgi:hypothetical protein
MEDHMAAAKYSAKLFVSALLLFAIAILFGIPLLAQGTRTEPLLERAEIEALVSKQKHRSAVIEKLKRSDSIDKQRPEMKRRSINDYPRGRFENLGRNRLQWAALSWFQFIPKTNMPFAFVRSTGERIEPKNFFTDGGSIPRVFQWGEELEPFGYLPVYLIHDWEFDLHHCKRASKTFEEVADTMMEALRTLMDDGHVPRNAFSFWMLEIGINSFVARQLWDTEPEKCPIPTYSPDP